MFDRRVRVTMQEPLPREVDANTILGPEVQAWGNAAAVEQLGSRGAGAAGSLRDNGQGILDALVSTTAPGLAGPATDLMQTVGYWLDAVETDDMRREGTFSDPRTGGAVDVGQARAEAGADQQRLGDHLMERYAFQPRGARTVAGDDRTLRLFAPGLNTPEPEASRRTQYYADHLGQPLVHLHNGTRQEAPVPGANRLDYLDNAVTRAVPDRSTDLIDSMTDVLSTALTGADPQDVHAILYSDSTLSGSRAIGRVRHQMVEARVAGGMAPEQATAEVEALLAEHLFVEMHGNVVDDLPAGPRYLLWADRKDGLTHQALPGTGGTVGLSARNPDADADAVYVEYDGPIGGEDAHNLAATGVHAVRATWAANGVSSSQELFERAKANGGQVAPHLPYEGDVTQLWNPANDPALQQKKP